MAWWLEGSEKRRGKRVCVTVRMAFVQMVNAIIIIIIS